MAQALGRGATLVIKIGANSFAHQPQRPVIVTVIAMRMVQMAVHQVVDMVAMRNRFVSALRPVDMRLRMRATSMARRARIRILRRYFQRMLVDMIAMRAVQVPVMDVIHMIVVHDGGVSAAFAVHMRMGFVDGVFRAHRIQRQINTRRPRAPLHRRPSVIAFLVNPTRTAA